MLTFVTTIRHPLNATSFSRVGRLLDATLRSVCRQTDADFKVVVVHNEMPPVEFVDSRICMVQVDFPAPSPERTARIDFDLCRRDRGTKYVVGVAAARDLGADHVMFFDADDLLHHTLAAHASAHPSHPGWFSPQGYIHTKGLRTVQFMADGFQHKNGSTGIVRTDLAGVPDELDTGASQADILDALSAEYVDRMFGEHGHWQEHLAEGDHLVEPLPFPAAVWVIGTGENHSGNLTSGRRSQPITPAISDAFGLQPPPVWSHGVTTGSVMVRRVARRLQERRIRSQRRSTAAPVS